MSGRVVAEIIGACGAIVGPIITTVVVQRRLSRRDNSISMQQNYQALYLEMHKDIGRIRDEQKDERQQWANERTALYDQFNKMQERIRVLTETNHSKEIEVTELRGKVELLQSQLEIYRESHVAAKQVTIKT